MPVHIDEMDQIPVEDSGFSDSSIVGLNSKYAEELEKKGWPVFYYDIEQLEAGLDKVYGLSRLRKLSADHRFSNGVEGKSGALVAFITKVDLDTFVYTIMVEQL